MRRELWRLSLPFKQPFVLASAVVAARDLLVLRLEDDDGAAGYGEAAPFEPYDGVPLARVADALLGHAEGEPPAQARAAEEMALLDLEGRRSGAPVGEPGAELLAVNLTLPAGSPGEVAERAREGVRAGYSCFKVKVGLADDLERVTAVRAAIGSWPGLRIDANGAWSVAEAVSRIGELAMLGIEYVEQPCRTLPELAAVRRAAGVPVAADESIASAADVEAAAAAEACDVACVKLAPAGGYRAARDAIRSARRHGMEVTVSSTLDGPWGIAAGLRLAAAEAVTIACGLATLPLFDSPLAHWLPAPSAGLLEVPDGPGLGVAVDEDELAAAVAERLA